MVAWPLLQAALSSEFLSVVLVHHAPGSTMR
jgi:hypothetical protein